MDLTYPKAVQRPLKDHSAPGTVSQRKLIVLHITEGSTAEGAISTFESSRAPNRVSAHFVIDRDGTVYQLLPLSDTAWHASAVNGHSIGIEHVALSAVGSARLNAQHKTVAGFHPMPCTDAQYAASAELVKWLAIGLNIPIDRQNIATHNECSPQDGHSLCCIGGLDPDRVVKMAKALASV